VWYQHSFFSLRQESSTSILWVNLPIWVNSWIDNLINYSSHLVYNTSFMVVSLKTAIYLTNSELLHLYHIPSSIACMSAPMFTMDFSVGIIWYLRSLVLFVMGLCTLIARVHCTDWEILQRQQQQEKGNWPTNFDPQQLSQSHYSMWVFKYNSFSLIDCYNIFTCTMCCVQLCMCMYGGVGGCECVSACMHKFRLWRHWLANSAKHSNTDQSKVNCHTKYSSTDLRNEVVLRLNLRA